MEGNDRGLLMVILKYFYSVLRAVAINTVKSAVFGVEIRIHDLPKIKQSFRYGGLFSMKLTFEKRWEYYANCGQDSLWSSRKDTALNSVN
jgi:hypothetical protein